MENKYEELQQQIENKEKQIEILQNDIQELETTMELYQTERFTAILEKANTLGNKYYLDYNSCFNEIYFCYCKNANKVSTGVTIENKCVEISQSNSIRFYETYTKDISSMEFFDRKVFLYEKQIKEIYNEINKTICGEQSVAYLYRYLKYLYHSIYNSIKS